MRRYKYSGYALITIGLYIFWSSILLPLSADHTPLCGGCHAPSRAYQSANFSAHREIGCLACHRDAGIGGRLAADFRGLRNLSAVFTGLRGRERYIDNDACLDCHDKIIDGTTRNRTIKMSHREVIDAGWRCGECHGDTGHKLDPVKSALQTPSMDKCFSCHLSQPRLRRCRTCHIGAVPKGAPSKVATFGTAAHTKDWEKSRHGQAPRNFCPVCHKGAFCKACHQVDLPHSGVSWPYQHSTAAVISSKACARCHQAKFCLNCHKLSMPHPNDYNRRHIIDRQSRDPLCYNCHLQDQCAACHRAHRTHGVGG